MAFENGVKNIQAAAYNGARTVIIDNFMNFNHICNFARITVVQLAEFAFQVNQACINHITHADNRCVPCCRVRGCGPPLQACQYIPDDDICPPPGTGCPIENVETRYLRTKSRRVCSVDDV